MLRCGCRSVERALHVQVDFCIMYRCRTYSFEGQIDASDTIMQSLPQHVAYGQLRSQNWCSSIEITRQHRTRDPCCDAGVITVSCYLVLHGARRHGASIVRRAHGYDSTTHRRALPFIWIQYSHPERPDLSFVCCLSKHVGMTMNTDLGTVLHLFPVDLRLADPKIHSL